MGQLLMLFAGLQEGLSSAHTVPACPDASRRPFDAEYAFALWMS